MIGQHDAAGTDANGFSSGSHVPDDHCGRSARDARHAVMFCEPEALVAPTLCVSREVKRIAKRAGRIRARNDGREIEDRERGHDCAWLLVYGSEGVGTSRFQVHPPGPTALMARMRTRESCESSQPGSGSVAYLEAGLKL